MKKYFMEKEIMVRMDKTSMAKFKMFRLTMSK
jgi:hypothetical protein